MSISKKVTHLGIIILIVLLLFTQCRKGDEDPLISLKSRTARLTGEWLLTESEIDGFVTIDSEPTAYSDHFNGTTRSISFGSFNDFYTYRETFIFRKDGSYTRYQTYRGFTFTNDGAWYWAGKSEELELKKKEAIVLTGLSYVAPGDYTRNRSGRSIPPTRFFVIEKLKSKEMTLIEDYTDSDSDGYIEEFKGYLNFEKKGKDN